MKASNMIPFQVLIGGGKKLEMSIPVTHKMDGIPSFTEEHFQHYVEGLHPELKGQDYKIRF